MTTVKTVTELGLRENQAMEEYVKGKKVTSM